MSYTLRHAKFDLNNGFLDRLYNSIRNDAQTLQRVEWKDDRGSLIRVTMNFRDRGFQFTFLNGDILEVESLHCEKYVMHNGHPMSESARDSSIRINNMVADYV